MAGFVRIRQVESRPNISFGRTIPSTRDRHDFIPPPLYAIPVLVKKQLSFFVNGQNGQ